MQNRRVVVTGMGSISALGKNVAETWQNVVDCKSGIGPITMIDTTDLRFKNGGEIKNYNALDHFTEKEINLIDRFAQLGVIPAREAVQQSGIDWSDELKDNCCVIMGTSIGGQETTESSFYSLFKEGKNRVNLFTIPRIMPNAAASHITMQFGITGFAYAISTACASSNHAIGNAFWMVRNGTCDMAITGGSETPVNFGFLKAWEALRVVDPETCRPFSKDRQGMILGEGGAILVLETLDAALQRGAEIYAEIIGFGMSSDAGHITKPEQKGPEKAMRMALKDAAISPGKIDYINAHGTGTLANDSLETAAIKAVFGDHSKKLAVSSTKSLHGHVLGGTSAIEAVITTCALKHQVYPPTANYTVPDPECDLDVVPNQSRKGEMNYAMSNSFAFGGLNAVLVFKKWSGS
ncbi:MAG TPA: beta-ketoacyl-[acyl-carrier-protein] synthase family protein [Chitinophagaceae bacterium]|nr:beta-ketoacyl-[acyl-carrier-protein] synthase family protein [Chitinophagaceae bacterium]